MSLWLQNILVLAVVFASLAYILREAIKTLFSRKGKLGCCDRGCAEPSAPKKDQIVFLPAEFLASRKRKQ